MRPLNLLLLMACCAACSGVLAHSFQDQSLKIQLKGAIPNTNDWEEACETLGELFIDQQGPWGMGPFDTYTCYLNKEKILGEPTDGFGWNLRLRLKKSGAMEIALYHLAPPAKDKKKPIHRHVVRLRFPRYKHNITLLKQVDFSALVAMYFLDQLPAAYLIAGRELTSGKVRTFGGPSFPRKLLWPLPRPSESLYVYDLSLQETERFFRASSLGIAQLDEPAMPLDPQCPAGAAWNIRQKSADHSGRFAYMQSRAGIGQRAKAIKRLLGRAHREMRKAHDDDSLDELFDNQEDCDNYGGRRDFRYLTIAPRIGRSLITEPGILSQAMLFQLLFEIHYGWLDGLLVNYDLIPEVKAGSNSFGMNRVNLGYRIPFYIEKWTWGIVDVIDVVPQVGAWSVDFAFDNDGVIETFKLDNDLNFGIELGFTKTFGWTHFRPWFSSNAVFAVMSEFDTGVSAQRYGMDLMIPGPDLAARAYSTIFLYGFIENVEFEKGKDDDLQTVEYLGGFLGGGFQFDW